MRRDCPRLQLALFAIRIGQVFELDRAQSRRHLSKDGEVLGVRPRRPIAEQAGAPAHVVETRPIALYIADPTYRCIVGVRRLHVGNQRGVIRVASCREATNVLPSRSTDLALPGESPINHLPPAVSHACFDVLAAVAPA